MRTLELWRKRRRLRRERKRLDKKHFAVRGKLEGEERRQAIIAYSSAREINRIDLEMVETQKINLTALKLGIEVPLQDKEVWVIYQVPIENGTQSKMVYTQEGKRRMWKLIRQERRSNAEFWIKILTPIIAALTGLAGTIIALISILKK